MFEYLKEDTRIFSAKHHGNKGAFKYFYYPDYRMILLIRFEQWLYKYRLMRPFAYLVVVLNDLLAGIWVGPKVKIGKGLSLGHARGLVINPNTIIGDYCTILNQVTIGGPNVEIGKYVEIGAGAKIISNFDRKVTVGDHCIIGAGSVVVKSLPPYSIVAGVPAKVIKEKELAAWCKRHPYYSVCERY